MIDYENVRLKQLKFTFNGGFAIVFEDNGGRIIRTYDDEAVKQSRLEIPDKYHQDRWMVGTYLLRNMRPRREFRRPIGQEEIIQ